MSQKGTCPICNRGPRAIINRHPETNQHICLTCYQRATGKRSPIKKGICPECGKGPRSICYLHPKTEQNICHNCYNKIKRRERGLRRVPKKLAEPVKVKLPRTKPTTRKRVKESARLHRTYRMPVVVPSAAAGEDLEELGRKAKYPTREAVIAVLENREIQGEDNFPSVLPTTLYHSALRFDVELPTKKNPPVRYYPGDLVKNQNSRDPDICGRIGKVLDSSEKEVRVNFRERGRITRVYRKWENLNNITLHTRLIPVETAKKEAVLV